MRAWRARNTRRGELPQDAESVLLARSMDAPRSEVRVGLAALVAASVGERPSLAPWLVEHLRDDDARVRARCVEACVRHDQHPTADLATLARGATEDERLAWVHGLAVREAPVPLDAWVWPLDDASARVREAALVALSPRRDRAFAAHVAPRLLDVATAWPHAATWLRATFHDDGDALDAALRAAAAQHYWTAERAQLAHARIATDSAMPELLRALFESPQAAYREAAVETATLRHVEAIDTDTLRALLMDEAEAVRAAAWCYVADVAQRPPDDEAIARALEDVAVVRCAALRAIGRWGAVDAATTRERLIRGVCDEAAGNSEAASEALREVCARCGHAEATLRGYADAMAAAIEVPGWRAWDGTRRDRLARRALLDFADTLSCIAFLRATET